MPIFLDNFVYPVNETLDGMDSSLRAAMITIFGDSLLKIKIKDYEIYPGVLVRHPCQAPANNPKNNTRDNMIPMITALWFSGNSDVVRRFFWERFKHCFFAQNTERDVPGSTKYPFPHQFFKDSYPDASTIPMSWNWKTFRFETTMQNWEVHKAVSGNVEVESRYFDSADPFTADHVWHIIVCGRMWYLYWFGLIGLPWFVLSLLFHSRSAHKEHNQIICMCKAQGPWALRLFKKLVPEYARDLIVYWGSRREIEYAMNIIRELEEV